MDENNEQEQEIPHPLTQRVNDLGERARNQHTHLIRHLIQQGEMNQQQLVDIIETTKQVLELASPIRNIFPILAGQITTVEEIAVPVTTKTEELRKLLLTTEKLELNCPHHPGQKITFEVPRTTYQTNTGPCFVYDCPLHTSRNCKSGRLLTHKNWKDHITKKCLPNMICIKSSQPDAECGPI